MSQLLSVVVTVYNIENYVAECIESILNQTYENLEIIIVDDGSTDNSLQVCKKFIEKDKRIKVISKENGGPISARKEGIVNATGEYITYVDGDDWLEKNLYMSIMNDIDNADAYVYGLTCVYDDHTDTMINSCESGTYIAGKLQYIKKHSLYNGTLGNFGILPSVCSKVYRKELFEKNLFHVDDGVWLGEDACCTFPSLCDSEKIIINNDIVGYMYRKNNAGTMTSSYSFIEFERIERVFETLISAFTKKKADYMIEQLPYYLAFMFRNEMVLELSHLKISNIGVKSKHLKEIGRLKWVSFLTSNITMDDIDDESRLLIDNIDNRFILMFKWYLRRLNKRGRIYVD